VVPVHVPEGGAAIIRGGGTKGAIHLARPVCATAALASATTADEDPPCDPLLALVVHILSKLGFNSRTQIATWVAQQRAAAASERR
jgi:hypothetical protein